MLFEIIGKCFGFFRYLSISNVHWSDVGQLLVDNKFLYHSGCPHGAGQCGFCIILNLDIKLWVTNSAPYLNTIPMIQINANNTKVNMIWVYAYTLQTR